MKHERESLTRASLLHGSTCTYLSRLSHCRAASSLSLSFTAPPAVFQNDTVTVGLLSHNKILLGARVAATSQRFLDCRSPRTQPTCSPTSRGELVIVS